MARQDSDEVIIEPTPPGFTRRNWFKLALVLSALVSIGFGWISLKSRSERFARHARISRVAAGHKISVQWQYPDYLYWQLQRRFPRLSLPNFVFEDPGDVSSVSLNHSLNKQLPDQFYADLQDYRYIYRLTWLDGQDSEAIARILQLQQRLNALTLSVRQFHDWYLNHHSLFVNLDELSIDGLESPELNGSFLQAAVGAGRLQRLALHHLNLSREACSAIGKLGSLRHVDLTGCRLTSSLASELAGHSQLKRLTLDDTFVDDDFSDKLGCLVAIEKLSVQRTALTAVGLRTLARCTALIDLTTAGIRGDPQLLAALKNCHKLRSVDVVWSGHFSSTEIADFKMIPDVTYLYFAHIGDAEAESLVQCEHLTGLDIHSTRMTLRGIQSLMKMTDLRHLRLAGTAWGRELVDVLYESPTLETVTILDRRWEWWEFENLRQRL